MDQGLVDAGTLEGEVLDLLGEWQLGDGHLVLDRSGLLLCYLGGEQVRDDAGGLMLALIFVGIKGGMTAFEHAALPARRVITEMPAWGTT